VSASPVSPIGPTLSLVDAQREPADPEPLQLLRPNGTLDPDSPIQLEVTASLCQGLYRDMLLARTLDQEAYHLQRQGELGLWLSCRGQEAAQVGSARAARDTDRIFPSYREHAVGLARGLTPVQLLSQWRGCSHGPWDPDEHNLHIYSLVLGTQTLHATGYAMGIRAEGSDEVVLAYVGDGAMSQGDPNEALNWATVTHSPIVFVCQNNQWAISTPASAQSGTPLHRRAAGFGLQTSYVDGNDVLATYAVVRDAVAQVRAGGPPAFVEALTYRIAGHSTSDDPRRYRTDAELTLWEQRDPLARMLSFLERQGWADPPYLGELAAEAAQLAADTRTGCLSLEPPLLEDTFRNTLVTETATLRTERERFTAYRESFL
jgi:2-oxoisovalerate dehydrogenase E1 component alpha subunit